MSIVISVTCDGTPADRPSIPLAQCRASFPTSTGLTNDALLAALAKGWSILDDGRHLCPSCTGAKARQR